MLIAVSLAFFLFITPQAGFDEGLVAMQEAESRSDWQRLGELARQNLTIADGLSDAQRADRADAIAFVHHGLARALHGLGDSQGALAELGRGLQLSTTSPGFRSLLLSRRALLLLDLGLPDLAQKPADAAVQESLNDSGPSGRNKAAFGNAFLIQAQQRLAVEQYEEACQVIESFWAESDKVGLLEQLDESRRRSLMGAFLTLNGAALHTLAARDPELLGSARDALHEAVDITPPRERFAALAHLTAVELGASDLDAAAGWLEQLTETLALPGSPAPTPDQLIWQAVLEAKLAHARSESAVAALAETFGELIESWREVDRDGGIGVLRYQHLQRAIGTLVSLSTPEKALEYVTESQRMGILWRGLGRPQARASEIREELTGAKTGCLVIVQGGEEVFVIAFDSKRIVVEAAGSVAELLALARTLVATLNRDPTASARRQEARLVKIEDTARNLGEKLFPESVHEISSEWSSLRIVGREFLYGLPLELLSFDGEPLGIRFALSDLPSLPIGWSLSKRHAGRSALSAEAMRRVVLVGMPVVDPASLALLSVPKLETIPLSVLEELRKSRGGFELVTRTGESATVAALAKPLQNEARFLHILAHGASETGRELQRVIALTPDSSNPNGLLRVEAARGFSFPEVVLLSVCRAARGAERIGDPGASHFGGSALLAGASTAIVASGDLRLPVALEFSKWIYQHLSAGLGPAEALRRARIELRKNPSFADPADWATTYAYGLGE